jgi:hypothetical protein
MSAHSPAAAVSVAVSQGEPSSNWASWLQHIALALQQLMQWCNQPKLVAQTVATLPAQPLPGMLAYVTDSTVASGALGGGGGTIPCLVWHNGTAWKVVAS